ncbi:verprolin [Verticillium alfalfae VaMs.102]|uniref:Verprolin n=1 Tax=Verticillium alfalfae (strain VaMs.102 / ATCC MYA-4576 / FGSC 10136) TaxID=526221 RepID=C9SK00_VERA1|nr:verprolin [Verticillium alfalfae VaMs.102]EEY19018.1 verprolin [Verticillium alfalfae VaMs.102]
MSGGRYITNGYKPQMETMPSSLRVPQSSHSGAELPPKTQPPRHGGAARMASDAERCRAGQSEAERTNGTGWIDHTLRVELLFVPKVNFIESFVDRGSLSFIKGPVVSHSIPRFLLLHQSSRADAARLFLLRLLLHPTPIFTRSLPANRHSGRHRRLCFAPASQSTSFSEHQLPGASASQTASTNTQPDATMAELVLLPTSTYQPPSPSQGRRPGRLLNTIIEEENEDGQQWHQLQLRQNQRQRDGRKLQPPANVQIEAWLSPMSDHFPTPRGFHFMSAPILPSSPSDDSVEEPLSPTTTSNPWNHRASVMTDITEFDDLYGISDDEEQRLRGMPSRKSSVRRRNTADAVNHVQTAMTARKGLPPLVIPAALINTTDDRSARSLKNKLISPVPPTPPTRVEMSPEPGRQPDFGAAGPNVGAPTPVIGNDDGDKAEDWSGVQLQPGALATLQALSGDNDSVDGHHEHQEQVLEIPQEPVREMRQQNLRIFTNIRATAPRSGEMTPGSQRRSLADLSKLEIPSPGGFFSGLSPRTRTTWHMPSRTPEDMVPPTSTTAEQFYRCPWNVDASVPPVPALPSLPVRQPAAAASSMAEQFYRSIAIPSSPVERIIEVAEDDVEDDMPTARPVVPTIASGSSTPADPVSPGVDGAATEIVTTYDPEYARKQEEVALSNLDRTGIWLMAQRAYLKAIDVDAEDSEQQDQGLETIPEAAEESGDLVVKAPEPASADLPKKKTVRFSALVSLTNVPRSLPSKLLRQESAYYRAFQDYIIQRGHLDAFVHQLPRFEVLQAQRVCRREYHRSQLLGKYQLSVMPQSAKKRLSANVARGDDVLIDDPEKLKREKEQEAMSQTSMSNWHVAATRYLNGGRLISAPVAKRLGRLSRMAPGPDGYPNTKIYTVTTKAVRQLSNSNIRGPPNHRQVAVERLTRLPFADAQFDLVSARELHSLLKFVGGNGEDEWEGCLRECMRVLKPGGYLDFSLLDSDLMNAGPLGLAKSVEFGFTLKTLGYDPAPTRMWLARLARAGFPGDAPRLVLSAHRRPPAGASPLPALSGRCRRGGKTAHA